MTDATATAPAQVDEFAGGEEVKSNWFKFEKVGDFIKGTLLNKRFQKANLPGYQDQWVYEIKDSRDGVIRNVGINAGKSGTVQRLNTCQFGLIVGIKYDKDGEAKKGMAAPKYLVVKSFGMDPEYTGMEGGEPISEDQPEM